jgi:tellurite methyltransferase
LPAAQRSTPTPNWVRYYRWTAGRPPRELLLRTLEHITWEKRPRRRRTAIDLGCGAGNDTLELLRQGWQVLSIDQQPAALKLLARRVPNRWSGRLTLLSAPMEGLSLPRADLVYASFSLPFCAPDQFDALWRSIHRSLAPGGHFAGQLFGDRDEWCGERPLSFHSLRQVRGLLKGSRVELLREIEEEGRSFEGPKHWHYFDLIVEKARTA